MNDPAYTEDVRHLALPLRRNSGPELNIPRLLSGRGASKRGTEEFSWAIMDSIKSNTYDPRPGRKNIKNNNNNKVISNRKGGSNNLLDNISTCSSDNNLDDEIVFFTKRGQSLDRRGFSLDYIEQKQLSWFQREFLRGGIDLGTNIEGDSFKNQRTSRDRHSIDYLQDEDSSEQQTSYSKQHSFPKQKQSVQRQNATRTKSNTPPDDLYKKNSKKNKSEGKTKNKESSRFQIGKRFLRGEIGIKSFNYYLIKEGLKSSKKKQKTTPLKAISKSEENIYEEIFFSDKPLDDETPSIQSTVPNQQKIYEPIKTQKDLSSSATTSTTTYQHDLQRQPDETNINFLDCALCVEQCTDKNCEICIKQQLQDYNNTPNSYGTLTKDFVQTYAIVRENDKNNFNIYQQIQNPVTNVLQFQSYNPNNPNVYKIETTPVAFNTEFNPMTSNKYGTIGPNLGIDPNLQQHQTIYYAQPATITTTFNPVYGYDTIGPGRARSSSSSESMQPRQIMRPVEHIYAQPDFSNR